MRRLVLAGCVMALAGCGSTTTRTVRVMTAVAPPPTGTSASTLATSPTRSTPAPAAPVYFQGAVGGGARRPTSLQLTADGTLSVEQVQWTSWGGATATGSGSALYHGCTPNCAAAPTHAAVVSIRLTDIRTCTGRRYYAGITLTRNSGRLLDEGFLQRLWSPC